MATNNREAIQTLMNITGLSEPVAVQKLEEYGGDLNAAVNAHFIEGDINVPSSVQERRVVESQDDLMDIDEPRQTGVQQSISNLSGTTNPFSVLDSTLGRVDGHSEFSNQAPVVSQPRDIREIPMEVKDGNQSTSQSFHAPSIGDVTGTASAHDPYFRGTVMVNSNDDATTINQNAQESCDVSNLPGSDARASAPAIEDAADFGNDIEEEMIHAAIQASKREVKQKHPNQPFGAQATQSNLEDPELAHAVSLSLKTAEEEKALRELGDVEVLKAAPTESSDVGLVNPALSNGRLEAGSTSVPDATEDVEEEPLDEEARASTGTYSGEHPQHSTSSFHTDVWGGMSAEEHDEAVMLEAAMFGGIPEGSTYHNAYAPHQFRQHENAYPRPAPRPPSPSLTAQRLIREQQDDEYLASLQADREKELWAKEEAKAAREEERRIEEESRQKWQEEQELERQLAAKEASLPQEPSSDDENGVTLLVRMPDGSRRGRRFLKSNSLQSLFDFIDVARVFKPGTYRLVRPYPRRAFSDGESSLTLNELGLTTKQEALFLELI